MARLVRFLARFLICFCVLSPSPLVRADGTSAETYFGQWLGKISIPNGPTLAIGFELFARADGSPGAFLVSPDQGVFGMPIDKVSITGDQLELSASEINMKLSLRGTAQVLSGEVRQGPMTVPTELRPVSSFGEPVRPQTPVAPFPYAEEELVVTTPDGVKLSGTFTRPRGSARVPAVVFLHGSGPADRDENFGGGHRPFAVLADHLARQGIASFRYDKRGIKRSTGDYASTDTHLLAQDGLAAVRAIRARKDVRRVGVIGHSEGGILGPMIVASDPAAVDFVVSLAGPGMNGLDLMLLQDHVGRERRGMPQDQIEKLDAYGRRFYEIVIANEQTDVRLKELRALFASLPDADKRLVLKSASQGSLSLQWAGKPALRAILLLDPPSYWRAVRCPVLALNGTLDEQVPHEQNLAGIRSALNAGGNKRARIETLPGLNHLLQTAGTGLDDEYATIAETLAPVVLKKVVTFIRSQH